MIQKVSTVEKEFLLRTIMKEHSPVRIHGVSNIATGLITDISKTEIRVTFHPPCSLNDFSLREHVTGYFDCIGKTYAFETVIQKNSEQQILLNYPENLLKSLQRKYVRVHKPKDIQVHFHLENEDINMDYPVCSEYVSVDSIQTHSQIRGKGLPEMIASFRKRLEGKCHTNTIVMFRTKKPENFEENLICETGKILFIPSTNSGLPQNDPYPEGRIITERIEETFEDPNFFVEGSKFAKLLKAKKDRNIQSEIWCPIIYYQYVVGYIYLANTNESFDFSTVDYLWDFSRILAFQLKQSTYFKDEAPNKDNPAHYAQIIDMSPGGMLISFPKNELRVPIKEGSIFSVDIHIEQKKINCSARITRRFEKNDTLFYGSVFVDLRPDNMMYLYEALYKRPFAENDVMTFEKAGSIS
ncbi:DUF1577 domain-containing protein [Brucepastera parasyntrophica]|uniref:PilZ domain-containing protein n=1 Tax=Brucepastera parasyntrophica TaxID=2880008 RepID=UPI00210D0E25|nr:PilZ domain-containing protein [Brucepastera parasyntrophica]ULQ60189.1 DUF1577 domain-containing protein [Brucepastera parasyntrophica]